MSDPVIIARDLSGLIIGWNAGAERLLKYTAAEIVGRPAETVIPRADLDELRRLEERVQRREPVAPIRVRHLSKDGATQILDVSVALTFTPEGTVAMITHLGATAAIDHDRWLAHQRLLDFGDSPEQGERERRFRQVIDAFPQLIWRSTPDGQVNLLTARWEEFTGRSDEALMGEAWLECVHANDRPVLLAHWQEARFETREWRTEIRLRRRDGEYCWMDVSGWPVLSRDGSVVCWFGSFTNVHEMREMQRALLEERQRLARIVASAPGAIYEFRIGPDRHVTFPFVSPGIRELYPVGIEALHRDARIAGKFNHPKDVERLWKATLYSIDHLTPFHCEWRINHPWKGEMWAEARAVPVRDADGGTTSYGFIFDVTERKRADEQLRLSQARLQAAVSAGGIGTWIRDLQTQALWWDDTMLRIWGRTAAEVNGRPAASILEFVHPDDRSVVRTSIHDSVDGKERGANEFRVIRADGSMRWVASNGVVERDREGKPIRMIGACMDTTARKQAEEVQRRSQRLEALGTLAGGIAHDFNNILLAITGNARLAAADLPREHPLQNSLQEIDKAAVRATSLVQRILAFSRQTEPRREVIQLQATVEEALTLLRSTLPAMVDIQTHFASGVPPINADSTQMHQVVMNLLTNAAYAIGEQAGVVTVSIDAAPLPNEAITQPASPAPGLYVRLTVSDTGAGISPATIERIFDPFFTTKPVGQGTGLGLSVVHGIVRSHRGAIAVESAPGAGAMFRLYFPAAQGGEPRQPEAHVEPAQGHGQRIMYVDDEDSLVYLVTRKLQKLGYSVAGFTDPAAAVAAFQAQPDAFDVVVTDVSMPGMSGFHFAKAILGIRPAIPVVMTSGYVRPEDREAALRLGVRDLIMKPNTIDELGQVLAAMFEAAPKSTRT